VGVSADGGAHLTFSLLDRVGGGAGLQDAPSVRTAVNGNTVYSAFTRWNSLVENDSDGLRFNSQVVVVRSDNAGADGFSALGAGGNGVQVAAPIAGITGTQLPTPIVNTPLTLGQNRVGSDLAIAVDPGNAQHVYVAYDNEPGANHSGIVQLNVAESTDGGATWTTKYTSDSSVRTALPALSILPNGTIGLLYCNYNPTTDVLSQHLVTTGSDFASTADVTLAIERNSTPIWSFQPYLGDFYDLTSVGNTFYGIFSASNADDGTNAQFSSTSFLRNHTGTPGTSNFRLTDTIGNTVPFR
jgi:hypothetical protein